MQTYAIKEDQWCPCDPLRSISELSVRQRQVLLELRRGPTNRQLATALGISEDTVKEYLGEIFRKLDISSRVQAGLLGFLVFHSLKPEHDHCPNDVGSSSCHDPAS